MTRHRTGTITSFLVAVLLLGFAPLAHSATLYVADTGADEPGCGASATTPCRSISQAIALAAAGDTILVSPGRYGDLNRNGIPGDIPGEETGSPGCSCVLSINKNVIVISSAGAAVTMIDGRSVDVSSNVLLITNGGEFGRPGKGFTVTETAHLTLNGDSQSNGIAIDSANVMVRGNQVIFTRRGRFSVGTGILTVNDAAIRIEGNQVIAWETGISGRGAATVSKNQVWYNENGIVATGGSVVGNVATANSRGIVVTGSSQVTSNAVYANGIESYDYISGGLVYFGFGIVVNGPFSGVITKNNLFGNPFESVNCGLRNNGVVGLAATNNYWGVPTGPGALPADNVCNFSGGTTTTSPFATKPFAVKVLKP